MIIENSLRANLIRIFSLLKVDIQNVNLFFVDKVVLILN